MNEKKSNWHLSRFLIGGYVVLAVMVFGLGAWAAVAKISGAVVIGGSLEVEGNRQVVQHPNGGVIEALNVRDGDEVRKGDVLVELEGDSMITELGIVEGQWFEILARKGRLAAERDGQDTITYDDEIASRAKDSPKIAELLKSQQQQFEARRKLNEDESNQITERQKQIQKEIDGLLAVQTANVEQVRLVKQEVTQQQTLLDKGLTEIGKLLALQRTLADLQGTAGQVEANIAENRGKIAELEINRVQIDSKTREEAISELRDLEFREIELREKRTDLKEQIGKLRLRAPVDGVIYGNTADTLRGVIRAAEPIMYVVPKDAPLIVRGHVLPTAIDQVHVGQEANLRFSAFDSRTTPELKGHILSISADAVEDKARGTRYYTADIQIDDHERDKIANRKLLPGMPVEAFIGTSERSPLSYFVKPFTDYFARAFQET
ncbi:HlyD family type I secretion periplasmic adaptor subunit [Amaricoccus solimangrovi]|nr:HlyD family type I secretion periplasmic adaptor subunit [Amaricoccus solimangrovi]